jgi:hypothetical protein
MELIFESIEILEDGTIKATTASVGETVHLKAEQFLQHLARMSGGESKRTKRADAHLHQHGHQHIHGGHVNTH